MIGIERTECLDQEVFLILGLKRKVILIVLLLVWMEDGCPLKNLEVSKDCPNFL